VSTGDAGPFHDRTVPARTPPTLWVHRVARPALVLGSSQGPELLDLHAAQRCGVEVAQRRSGGGLVLVHPDHARWIDVIVPRGHHRWSDDVGRAFWWLGQAWADAVRPEVSPATTVAHHQGPLERTRWSSLLCFAGLGPGEVTVGGSKVVGMSQRRTRHWARFQCLVVADADLEMLARLLAPASCPGPVEELLALPVGHRLDLDAVVARLLSALH
jgi:lipoate---protein ligase